MDDRMKCECEAMGAWFCLECDKNVAKCSPTCEHCGAAANYRRRGAAPDEIAHAPACCRARGCHEVCSHVCIDTPQACGNPSWAIDHCCKYAREINRPHGCFDAELRETPTEPMFRCHKLAEEIVDTAPDRWYWLPRSEGIAIVEGMLTRARKVIEAASAGAEERDCVRCGCTVLPERAFVLCVDCKPLAEIFVCEGCGVARDIRDLSDDGYCATCVAAPSESAGAEARAVTR